MKTLRSVSKIIFLVGELHDLPLKQSNIENYLNDHVLSLNSQLTKKWKLAYKCWKYSCCHHKLYVDNPNNFYVETETYIKHISHTYTILTTTTTS